MGTLSDCTYTYDAIGNRKTMTEPAGEHTYSYDPLYQLTGVDYPDGTGLTDTGYTLDPAGNRQRDCPVFS